MTACCGGRAAAASVGASASARGGSVNGRVAVATSEVSRGGSLGGAGRAGGMERRGGSLGGEERSGLGGLERRGGSLGGGEAAGLGGPSGAPGRASGGLGLPDDSVDASEADLSVDGSVDFDGDAGRTLDSEAPLDPAEESGDDVVDLSIIDSLVLGAHWSNETFDPGFSLEALQEIILRLGPPRENLTDDDLLAEAAVLDTELTRINRWGQFPRGIQRALLGLVACRMRRLQDDTPSRVRVVLELQLRRGFARLTQFSSEYQPGWVTGLSRQHKPESDSWLSDAHYWWNTVQRELGSIAIEQQKAHLNPEVSLNDLRGVLERSPEPGPVQKAANRALRAGVSPEDPRLVGLLRPHLEVIGSDKGLKRVRKAIREAAAPEPVLETGTEDELIPVEWPFFERTRGKVAAIVGGETRETRRAKIEGAFGFGALTWITGTELRAVQSLAERIAGGGVELVILLGRFLNHKVTDILLPACNQAQVDWVMVRQGYGVSQIRLAIERYLGEREGDETL
ncbi:MAG: hypothetical protein R3F65_11100 [bacterium]